MTALRQRLIEDMQVRNYSPRTVEAYVAAVAKLAKHFRRSPDQLSGEDVHVLQVHLLAQKVSWSQFNQIVSGLRFFFGTTLARPRTCWRRGSQRFGTTAC
jgi:integrase/recombinase XerD